MNDSGTGVRDLIESTRGRCREALSSEALDETAASIAARVGWSGCRSLIASVTESAESQARIRSLKDELARSGVPVAHAQVERCLLLGAAIHGLDALRQLPVTRRVKELICDELLFVASADGGSMAKSLVGTSRFVRLAKVVAYNRCPAGQFEWEVSGISRRDVLGVRPMRLPSTLAFLAFQMRGLGPVFFSHLNPRRPNTSLSEHEANRSYYQMAESMVLQPGVLGFAACSWFRSPSTHSVSPQLAWLSDVFVNNGGRVVDAGRADPDGGVLHRSATRRALHEAGQFVPRRGLVLWPRTAMLAWAAAHPELESARPHRI